MPDDAARWRRLESVVHGALAKPAEERAAFLAEACSGDSDLRRDAASLLERDGRAGEFLGTPLEAVAAGAIFAAEGTPPADEPRSLSGSRIGAYEIRERVGRGGMGIVYRARDTRLHRDVAVKVLLPAVTDDPDRLARFAREARILASLNHPRIAQIYGLEESEDVSALVMELVEGPTLADRIARGAIPSEEALGIAKQIADALEAAHDQGIVHRDLKPANVKVRPDGTVKVLDFGLAKAVDRAGAPAPGLSISPPITMPHPTRAGPILGTAAYMSPEQARGLPVDPRTDIWAFGVLLFEMLSGRRPFEGADLTEVLSAVLRAEPDWNALPPQGPSRMRQVIRACLQKDPRQRIAHAQDLRLALDGAFDAASGDARSEVAPVRRPAWPWLIAAVLALALGGVAGWQLRPSAPQPGEVIRFVVNDPPVAANFAGGLPSFAVARDGSVFVYVAVEDGVRHLYQRRIDDAASMRIPGTEGANTPFLSPDARWVGFTVSDNTANRLRRVSLSGGDPVTISELGANRGAAWGADGTIVFAPNPEFGLWQISSEGGTPVPITQPDASKGDRSHRWPFLLPDGRSVLYTIARSDITTFDDAVIAMRDLHTGVETELVRGGSFPVYLAATGHLLYSRAGTLLAVPLDLEHRTARGPAVTVLTNVVTYPFTGGAEVAISESGVLLSLTGRATPASQGAVLLVDRHGDATTIPFPPGALGPALLASDGRTVALGVDGANSSIWIGDIAKATTVRITPSWTNIWPRWSPDGSRVAYASGRGDGHRVWVQAIDGRSQPEQLTGGVHRHSVPTSWSSDGRYIAYDDQVPPARRDVMVVDLIDQRRTFPLVQSPFDEHSGKFSPDMHHVAYVSNESGSPEVYLQTFPERTRPVRVSRTGGLQPVWARNGRELFYIDGDAMMAVAITTSPELSVGRPRVLFRRALPNIYDVTLDGKFLLFEQRQSLLHAAPLSVTVNWLDALRKAM
jgi:eukaryotic-like serine/threonine-protein kinase